MVATVMLKWISEFVWKATRQENISSRQKFDSWKMAYVHGLIYR